MLLAVHIKNPLADMILGPWTIYVNIVRLSTGKLKKLAM
jgi:hypothetical protein